MTTSRVATAAAAAAAAEKNSFIVGVVNGYDDLMIMNLALAENLLALWVWISLLQFFLQSFLQSFLTFFIC